MGSETERPYSIKWTQSNPVLCMRITSSLKPLLRAELLMGRMGEMRSPQNELAKQVNAFRFVKSLNYINFFSQNFLERIAICTFVNLFIYSKHIVCIQNFQYVHACLLINYQIPVPSLPLLCSHQWVNLLIFPSESAKTGTDE